MVLQSIEPTPLTCWVCVFRFDFCGRGPLAFLAGMPPGNVVGLIDLEGEAALNFGGGGRDDGVEGNINKGSGAERIARLSKGAYNAVMLTPSWRCRARLAAGGWLLAYWPVRTFR